MTTTATPDAAEGTSALAPPKKTKVYRTEFATAHRACRTTAEREQLSEVIRRGWTEAQLTEYARRYFFRNGKDYPTGVSYREAIATIVSSCGDRSWRKKFSEPLSPRPERLLVRGKGFMTGAVTSADYSWPGHTEDFRSMIEQRCRAYFHIAAGKPVNVNAWAASLRWYEREQLDLRIAAEEARYSLIPKALKKSPPTGYKVVSSFLYVARSYGDGSYSEGALHPHFNRDFKGHTAEFREDVAALARKDNHLRPSTTVSRERWNTACHKHFVLLKRTQV